MAWLKWGTLKEPRYGETNAVNNTKKCVCTSLIPLWLNEKPIILWVVNLGINLIKFSVQLLFSCIMFNKGSVASVSSTSAYWNEFHFTSLCTFTTIQIKTVGNANSVSNLTSLVDLVLPYLCQVYYFMPHLQFVEKLNTDIKSSCFPSLHYYFYTVFQFPCQFVCHWKFTLVWVHLCSLFRVPVSFMCLFSSNTCHTWFYSTFWWSLYGSASIAIIGYHLNIYNITVSLLLPTYLY